MEGRHLGSYRIVSPLGVGGMGEVYRAFDEKLQRDVAIKVLPASGAHDPAAGRRLVREARAAAALNHPNICTIHEVGEHEGRAFIAMELVEGAALHHAVPPGTGLSTELISKYGSQIADALAHAHERGVLSIAYEPHHAFVPWVRVEPAMIRLKDDPRYAPLFARFKLPLPKR